MATKKAESATKESSAVKSSSAAKAPVLFKVTGTAAAKLLEIAKQEKKEGASVRIMMSQGCCGPNFSMDFDKSTSKTDISFNAKGVRFVFDSKLKDALKDVEMDFV